MAKKVEGTGTGLGIETAGDRKVRKMSCEGLFSGRCGPDCECDCEEKGKAGADPCGDEAGERLARVIGRMYSGMITLRTRTHAEHKGPGWMKGRD